MTNGIIVSVEYNRQLLLHDLLKKKSFFLFGPRSVGKTSLIKKQLPQAQIFDLLDPNIYGQLVRRPNSLTELVTKNASIVVIDEVQKLPSLLDQVHKLIFERKIHFLLTGSSARKLKRSSKVNLLGGRAWEAELLPLTSNEITDFSLTRYLNRGGLPHIYLSDEPNEELRSYINLYLRQEIAEEAVTRNIEAFARFLDVMAMQNGEELYFQGLASDAAVNAKTLQNYVQILEDTLIGFRLNPFLASKKRKAISRAKFYFFDIGIVNALSRRGLIEERSELFGKAFEHFILLEIRAYLSYRRLDLELCYWRSKSQFEVDCIIGRELALEIKSTDSAHEGHLKGLRALREEKKISKYCIVSRDSHQREIDGITVYPWQRFLELLWADKLLK